MLCIMNSDYHRWLKKRDDFGVPVTLQFDTWKSYNLNLQKIQMSEWNTGVFTSHLKIQYSRLLHLFCITFLIVIIENKNKHIKQ